MQRRRGGQPANRNTSSPCCFRAATNPPRTFARVAAGRLALGLVAAIAAVADAVVHAGRRDKHALVPGVAAPESPPRASRRAGFVAAVDAIAVVVVHPPDRERLARAVVAAELGAAFGVVDLLCAGAGEAGGQREGGKREVKSVRRKEYACKVRWERAKIGRRGGWGVRRELGGSRGNIYAVHTRPGGQVLTWGAVHRRPVQRVCAALFPFTDRSKRAQPLNTSMHVLANTYLRQAHQQSMLWPRPARQPHRPDEHRACQECGSLHVTTILDVTRRVH